MNALRSFLFLFFVGITTSLSAHAIPDLSGVDTNESEFLSAADAFRVQVSTIDHGWLVHFDIAEHYYLYQSRIRLLDQNDGDDLVFRQVAESKLDKNFGRVDIFHHSLDIEVMNGADIDRVLSYQGCSEQGLCYPPQKLDLTIHTGEPKAKVVDSANGGDLGSKSLFWIIVSFFGLGIGLSLTPCVFPMIPILSSIIVGQKGDDMSPAKGLSLALAYVVGMASSYALIGALVAAFGAQVNLAAFTQTPLVIGFAAILFIVLALPMFGLFELQLPAGLRNRLNDMSSRQKGGAFLSTYVMGFLAALVVSPCVSAPLAGALIYLSSTGDVLTGGSALFALGMGMGAPLLLIGLSGGKLLPRAGTWMIAIKGAFGVGLLAVAVSLLARLLPPPALLAMSGALAIGIAVYLGVFESAVTNKAKFTRVIALIAFLCGTGWLIGAGMGNGNLLRPLVVSTVSSGLVSSHESSNVYTTRAELERAIANANAEQSLVVVDVYADWCTSCKEMDHLLADADVAKQMEGMTFMRFDITAGNKDQTDVLADWQVFGPPALQGFDINGHNDVGALQGLPTKAALLQWLRTL